MLITILEVVLLLGIIIIPLRPQKKKNKDHKKDDSNTANATYAIAENGRLEKVRPVNSDAH